jgi:hypothetical protein
VRKFKQFIDTDMLSEKQALIDPRVDIQRVKRAILRLVNRIVEKHQALQQKLTELVNTETANYAYTAAQVANGFSLYFNDFTD